MKQIVINCDSISEFIDTKDMIETMGFDGAIKCYINSNLGFELEEISPTKYTHGENSLTIESGFKSLMGVEVLGGDLFLDHKMKLDEVIIKKSNNV